MCQKVIKQSTNANHSRNNCNDNNRDSETIKIDCINSILDSIFFRLHSITVSCGGTKQTIWISFATICRSIHNLQTKFICSPSISNTNYSLSIKLNTSKEWPQRSKCRKKFGCRYVVCIHFAAIAPNRSRGGEMFSLCFCSHSLAHSHTQNAYCGSAMKHRVRAFVINHSCSRLEVRNRLSDIYQYFDHQNVIYIIKNV